MPLIVFEWEEDESKHLSSTGNIQSNHDLGGEVQRTKFRLERGDATTSGLWKRLANILPLPPPAQQQQQQQQQEVSDDIHHLVEIFDASQSSYVAISTYEHCTEEQLSERFGKIWRVRATIQRQQRQNQTKGSATGTTWLALPGRAFSSTSSSDNNNMNRFHVTEEAYLQIQERHNQQDSDSTAFTVWDGSVLLAEYLKKYPVETVKRRNVLELGSGCGLVGLTAAVLGAKYVYLSDLPEAIPLLEENIQVNQRLMWDAAGGAQQGVVTCGELDWFHPHPLPTPPAEAGDNKEEESGDWDVILIADCVWTLDLVAPLIGTLQALVRLAEQTRRGKSSPPDLLISYQRRGHHAHKAFWEGISNYFIIQDLNASQLGITLPNPELTLSRCRPKRSGEKPSAIS